ncbi:hypothetical protein HZH68_013620 [Vespula germanica]|uniref:Uncharacterized protein n=1 Tax=Vespula germanica TaxID=30212 RepID=A0A834JD76_VESGE|nr:hypothetical protein HZH68_013620 [Vespula germanica]
MDNRGSRCYGSIDPNLFRATELKPGSGHRGCPIVNESNTWSSYKVGNFNGACSTQYLVHGKRFRPKITDGQVTTHEPPDTTEETDMFSILNISAIFLKLSVTNTQV